jgi:hypothetical protein
MKKILLISTLFMMLLTSCSTVPKSSFYYTDFKQFYDDGFFVTESNSLPFDYIPMGSLKVVNNWDEIVVKGQKVKNTKEVMVDDIYSEGTRTIVPKKVTAPTAESALKEAKAFADKQGADGIMNLDIRHKDNAVILNGMLFKRK